MSTACAIHLLGASDVPPLVHLKRTVIAPYAIAWAFDPSTGERVGKVARWAHAESPFGLELDSLADVVSFGIAPSLALYIWGLVDLGRLGWVSAFGRATRYHHGFVRAPSRHPKQGPTTPRPATRRRAS